MCLVLPFIKTDNVIYQLRIESQPQFLFREQEQSLEDILHYLSL